MKTLLIYFLKKINGLIRWNILWLITGLFLGWALTWFQIHGELVDMCADMLPKKIELKQDGQVIGFFPRAEIERLMEKNRADWQGETIDRSNRDS